MVDSVNTNSGAATGVRILDLTSRLGDRTQNRISTGLRINDPKQDAATFAVAQQVLGEIAGERAVKEALNFGEAAVGTAIAGGQAISDQLIELKALAVQASDQTLNADQRQALTTEFNALREQIDTIAASSGFAGTNLVAAGGSDLEVLSDQDGNTISVSAQDLSAGGLGLSGLSLDTAADALSALSSLDSAIGQASTAVASLGSSASRIENQSEFTTTLVDSLRSELGNLVDANLAEESAASQANLVRQRLGITALNIANSSPQTLLALFE